MPPWLRKVSLNTGQRRSKIPIEVIFSVSGALMHRITILDSEGVKLSPVPNVTVIFLFLVCKIKPPIWHISTPHRNTKIQNPVYWVLGYRNKGVHPGVFIFRRCKYFFRVDADSVKRKYWLHLLMWSEDSCDES